MLFFKLLGGLIKTLNSDAHPMQIAGGAWIGCMMGMTPTLGWHWVLLMCLLLCVRVNIGSGMLFWGITKLLSFPVAPVLSIPIGRAMLAEGSIFRSPIVSLLDTPVIGLVRLEKHAILGGLIVGFFLGALLAWPVMRGISAYRVHVKEGFKNSKTLRWLSKTWIFKIFKALLEGTSI